MATQNYVPQQYMTPPQMPGAPRQRPAKWVPTAGTRHIITIGEIPGRMVPSTFGVSEVVFDVEGGRPWYVPQVTADEIYRLGVRSGDQVEVTVTGRKKTDLLIIPLQPRLAAGGAQPQNAPPAGNNGHSNGYRNGTPIPPPPPPPAVDPPLRAHDKSAPISPAAACMCSAICAAVDAVVEGQAYAKAKGLGVTFNEESVRTMALSIYINTCKGGQR